MKNGIICLIALIFCANVIAQDKPIKVKSEFEQITVYLNGAEIKRIAKVNLKAGKNKIVMMDLSNTLEPTSVQVGIGNNVQMLGIATKNDFLNVSDLVPRIAVINDSLKMIKRQLKRIDNTLEGYHVEKAMLNQNQKMVGSDALLTVAELDKATSFFRKRIWEINEGKTQLEWDRADLQVEQGKLQRQLNDLNAQANPSRKVVSVEVESPVTQNVEVRLRYLVRDAGWAPSYDIIAQDIEKGIDLKYNGKVFNSTGLDWNDVQLLLSTADPYECQTAPVISRWNLGYDGLGGPEMLQAKGRLNQLQIGYENMARPDSEMEDANFGEDNGFGIAGNGGQTMMVSLPELSAEFVIDKKYSIPSDRKSYLVKINEFDLNAEFEHYVVPKMDKDAFLITKLSGWQKLDLIDGPANIYYGDTYVGESIINTRNTNDTIDISLGRDKQVLVTRVKKEDLTKEKTIGSKKKVTYAFEMTVKNNRNIPINLEMKDQIPVAQMDDIEVQALELSGGDLDESTGIVTWRIEAKPGESKKINFAFEVKYPKNKKISLQNRKYRNASYF